MKVVILSQLFLLNSTKLHFVLNKTKQQRFVFMIPIKTLFQKTFLLVFEL